MVFSIGSNITSGAETIDWWKAKERDLRQKLLVFSDTMDVESIEEIQRRFRPRSALIRLGHHLTNDFVGCSLDGAVDRDPSRWSAR
jgi:nicotinate phosphoribosyltransferase